MNRNDNTYRLVISFLLIEQPCGYSNTAKIADKYFTKPNNAELCTLHQPSLDGDKSVTRASNRSQKSSHLNQTMAGLTIAFVSNIFQCIIKIFCGQLRLNSCKSDETKNTSKCGNGIKRY